MSFKQLRPSDILNSPVELNKDWVYSYSQLNNGANEVKVYSGKNSDTPFDERFELRSHDLYEKLLFHSINQVYYNQLPKDISTTTYFGDLFSFENDLYTNPVYTGIIKRFPTSPNASIKVLRFNRKVIGESIKPGTFRLAGATYRLQDDKHGNIFDTLGDTLIHVGNIFYESGVAVITADSHQDIFPKLPVAINDEVEFYYEDAVKVIDPLANDLIPSPTYHLNSLKIVNPDEYISIVNNLIYYTNKEIGERIYYYTYEIFEGGCNGEHQVSNVGKITIRNTTRSNQFDFNVQLASTMCDFTIVYSGIVNYNKFDFFVEVMDTVCKFEGIVVNIGDICDFTITSFDNDVFCDFELIIEEINVVVTPSPSPTPTATPAPSVSATPGVTPTRTPTRTPEPTPTATAAPAGTCKTYQLEAGPGGTSRFTFINCSGVQIYTSTFAEGSVLIICALNIPQNVETPGVPSYGKITLMEGSGCNPDITPLPTAQPTPTPTRIPGVSPTATPSPTPIVQTPTPTKLPEVSQAVCRTYKLSAVGGPGVGQYNDCTFGTITNTGVIPDGNTVYVCAVQTPLDLSTSYGSTGHLDISVYQQGCGPGPTPTPTYAGVCKTYRIKGNNSSGNPSKVEYVNCSGQTVQSDLIMFGATAYVCALQTPVRISGYWGGATGEIVLWSDQGCYPTGELPTPTPTQPANCGPNQVIINGECKCPPDWAIGFDGKSYQTLSAPPTASPSNYSIALAPNAFYSIDGTRIFENDFQTYQTLLTPNIWKASNALTGPMNRSAIWVRINGQFSAPLNTWLGFSHCINGLTQGKTYYVGIEADNAYRLRVNGNIVLEDTNVNATHFRTWKVYPIVAPTPNIVITMEGLNANNVAGFGCEVYNNTKEELINATSSGQLNIIFTSASRVNAKFDSGDRVDGVQYGYQCPDGYVYNPCTQTCERTIYCNLNT